MNESTYIKGLLTNDKTIVAAIYNNYLPRIEALILRNNGTRDDAWEIFQEALILILKKVREPDFQLTSNFYTFLYGVCRLLWSNELRKSHRKEVTIEDTNTFKVSQELETLFFEEDQRNLLREKFSQLDEGCRQMLELYFQGTKFKDIATQLALPSENAAKQKKFKCQRKLIALIQSDVRYKELKNDP